MKCPTCNKYKFKNLTAVRTHQRQVHEGWSGYHGKKAQVRTKPNGQTDMRPTVTPSVIVPLKVLLVLPERVLLKANSGQRWTAHSFHNMLEGSIIELQRLTTPKIEYGINDAISNVS